ncbi:transmembrane protein 272-like [Pyxicephalus adspersus]|uniref:transmembrane protein 272-like n=1 Tax=Pyxicephalus adspersus TaxID=30357 RepID=UPI003B59C3A1
MPDFSSSSTFILGVQLCTLGIWTALSIAMITIGSLFSDQCNIEPNIPWYLRVTGVVHIWGFVLVPVKMLWEKRVYFLEGILSLFSLCWFITGSVWVFRIYQVNPRDCNDTVYNFAFGTLIFEYILLCIAVTLICLGACSSCCLPTTGNNTETTRLNAE